MRGPNDFFQRDCRGVGRLGGDFIDGHDVLAQQSGTFKAIANYVRHFSTLEHAGETVFSGMLDGSVTILESSGSPFVAGRHSMSKCLAYGKRSAAGMDLETPCTIADPSGDRLYLLAKRSAGDVNAGGGGEGHFELMGGTGVYAGLAGRCAYKTDYLTNDRVITTTDCTWRKR